MERGSGQGFARASSVRLLMLPALLIELTSGDDTRALEAVQKLSLVGEEAIPSLAELLASDQPDTRWWAVCALSGINHPHTLPFLRGALHDSELAVRECAATGLRLHPHPILIPDLIAAMKTPHLLLTRLAANALVAIGREAVPMLLDMMEHGPQAARVEATKALAEIRDPRCIETFFRVIQNGDSPLVEYWADQGLERLGVGMSFFSPD
jgi:HEAT repeat protein